MQDEDVMDHRIGLGFARSETSLKSGTLRTGNKAYERKEMQLSVANHVCDTSVHESVFKFN